MALERDLGVKLIDRTKRPVELTGRGQVFRRGCEDILDRYQQLKQQVTGSGGQISGTVHVAAIYSAGIDLLNQVAEDFQRQHPQVRVRVQYLQPVGVYRCVKQHEAELGILSYPDRWQDLHARPLRNETMVVVCRPDHPLARRGELTPADLADQSLVGFEASLPIADRIAAHLRKHGVEPRLSHSFDNIDTIKAYLTYSEEVAILPDRPVQHEVETGQLAAIPLRPTLRRPVTIVSDPQRPLAPAVQAFSDALAATSPHEPLDEPATTTV
jgi:DNA-binding transcriptional LysR family regulator